MEDNIIKQDVRGECRYYLMTGGKGQFDLIPQVTSQDELRYAKPKHLLKSLLFRLDIPSGKIKPKSFRMWLSRYRAGMVRTDNDVRVQEKGRRTGAAEAERQKRGWFKL
jgi:hypothetical protein